MSAAAPPLGVPPQLLQLLPNANMSFQNNPAAKDAGGEIPFGSFSICWEAGGEIKQFHQSQAAHCWCGCCCRFCAVFLPSWRTFVSFCLRICFPKSQRGGSRVAWEFNNFRSHPARWQWLPLTGLPEDDGGEVGGANTEGSFLQLSAPPSWRFSCANLLLRHHFQILLLLYAQHSTRTYFPNRLSGAAGPSLGLMLKILYWFFFLKQIIDLLMYSGITTDLLTTTFYLLFSHIYIVTGYLIWRVRWSEGAEPNLNCGCGHFRSGAEILAESCLK